MPLNPDEAVLWEWGVLSVNATLFFTWVVMALLIALSVMVTRKLSARSDMPRAQNLLEILVLELHKQVAEVVPGHADRLLPFVGTLFVFVSTSSVLSVIPFFRAPTSSLSTTVALALCVFVAVPVFGISSQGLLPYLRQYLQPTVLMMPFNVLGEVSRTVALAVRLFGNMMSGSMLAAILLALVPFFFPVVMQLLGLLTGLVQAYVFAVLALVYIGSGIEAHDKVLAASSSKTHSAKP